MTDLRLAVMKRVSIIIITAVRTGSQIIFSLKSSKNALKQNKKSPETTFSRLGSPLNNTDVTYQSLAARQEVSISAAVRTSGCTIFGLRAVAWEHRSPRAGF